MNDFNSWCKKLSNHDPVALSQLMAEGRPKLLAPMVDHWCQQDSAWALSEQVRYFQLGVVPKGHRLVVRRLLRSAEEKRQNRIMSAAFVYVDHLWETTAFSARTTAYLRRFVWRYMRSLAKENPNDYCMAIATALRSYPHSFDSLSRNCLRYWCFMKACLGKHPGLAFTSQSVSLTGHQSISNLLSSRGQMHYSELWETEAGQREMRRIAAESRSRMIANWAKHQLRS